MGCYYTLYLNTYGYSLLFYKVYHEEGECRQLEFWLEKDRDLNTYGYSLLLHIDGRSRNKRTAISALAGRANKTASQRESRWGEKRQFMLDRATMQRHDVRRWPADQIYAMFPTMVCENHLADPNTV